MNDFTRILAASAGIGTAPHGPPPPSGMAVNTMKQLQILADILTTTALVEDKETIMQQVLRNFVSVLTAAYDDSQLEGAGLQDQAASDLQYLLQAIHNLPLDHKITEGGTHDMTALHLRKMSSIQARKQAQAAAAEEAAAAEKAAEEEKAAAAAEKEKEAAAAAQKAAMEAEKALEKIEETAPAEVMVETPMEPTANGDGDIDAVVAAPKIDTPDTIPAAAPVKGPSFDESPHVADPPPAPVE